MDEYMFKGGKGPDPKQAALDHEMDSYWASKPYPLVAFRLAARHSLAEACPLLPLTSARPMHCAEWRGGQQRVSAFMRSSAARQAQELRGGELCGGKQRGRNCCAMHAAFVSPRRMHAHVLASRCQNPATVSSAMVMLNVGLVRPP